MNRTILVGMSALFGLASLAVTPAVAAETAEETPSMKPIESLWFMSVRRFPGMPESDAALLKTLKQWQPTEVFDAFFLHDFPPTFANGQDFVPRANGLIQEVGGRFIIATLPVGKEGWESSGNERLANKQMGTHYDASKAVTQLQWLETLKDLRSDTWAWVLEQPARMPTPDQAARAATEFVRFAKAQHKQTVLILSAQALTHARSFAEMTKAICDATRTKADYFAWMDLPGETFQAGESQWRETMAKVLDKILAMSPKEKTVIQWLNNPRWPTKDVEGTKAYIAICQSKGINRFQVLFPPQGILDRDPWEQFYRTLPKTGAAAAKMGVAKAPDNNQPKSGDREAQMEQRMNDMSEELELTTDAKQKFKTVLQEQFTKMREIIQQSDGDREKARAEVTKLREETVNKLKDQGILNDEQLAKYQQLGPPMAAARVTAAAAPPTVADGPTGRTTLEFPAGTGHRWMVNGPGNNYWSNAPDVVWVDEKGLHLKIVKRGDQWRCSAVGLPEGLGYGKYIFSLATRVDRLDHNVVIGLFTYNNETFKTDANGELDVEITQWGKETPSHPQINYTVQPSMGRNPARGRGSGRNYRDVVDRHYQPQPGEYGGFACAGQRSRPVLLPHLSEQCPDRLDDDQ